ncbi:hypothetical protein ACO1O0_006824 [Amphichorda felina]
MTRDRKPAGVAIAGLLLSCPMLENRFDEADRKLFSADTTPMWSFESNDMVWKAYLGEQPDSAENPYHVPSRASNLSGLPPTYVDVGTAELFRKPVMRFAERLWDFMPGRGGYHIFGFVMPTASLSKKAIEAKYVWVRKGLGC